MSLKKKATKGSIWTSLTRTGINVVDFLVYAYLARVLTLEEFGLAGFCFLFIEFANTLVNAGVNQNLVQRDKWEDRYAASTMTFVAGMGLVVVIGILGIGAPIAYYSYSELAAWVVASLAPITLVTSLQVVVSGKLLREFKNKQMGVAKFCATLISATTIVILAEIGYGLWALIIGKLVNAVIQYLLLIYVAKFKPYFHFNRDDNKELIRFCLPLFGMTVMNFLHRKASNLFTGIVLGPASFALLAAAHKGELVINQVTMSSINTMVVPSFSRVEDKTKLGGLYVKMVSITAIIVLPIFLGLAAIADPFITVAFGEKFAPSAEFMTISAFGMIPSVVAWFLPNLLIANGKTKEAFNLTLLNIVSSVFVAGATIWFGVKIMLISVVVSAFVLLPVRLWIVDRHIRISKTDLFKAIFPSIFASLSMFTFLILIKERLATYLSNDIFLLVGLVALGGVTFVLVLFLFFGKFAVATSKELKSLLSKKAKK
ncbi:oligosaccharide flippase family protein [Alteromonas macleodii]|uniref:oligosaccharide flippase family protein n=1 Tax=Alteromonas macleodii TaxID=28108 RepID=UPI000C77FEBE|nr:oligosaccharide flippase family protein [Alteromonas macleodii]AUI82188.1 polysaccharide biosynthesis protein [Alteromonas macleodii]MEE3029077.1 oligosaccharide flippase family protein [Pseudomonadota bacterium]USI26323.1 oligosaccharide flippase family protein [Alteromonas macleodii]|tara:strand:- start:973 stop:2430 length:1458 start_codon:yes stop_codon:yes gene_type:complete